MKRLTIVISALLFFSSCESIVGGLDQSPNNPLDASEEHLFRGTQIAYMAAHEGFASKLSLVWVGYARGYTLQFGTWGQYQITANNFDGDWNLFFAGVNKNALLAIGKAEALNNRVMIGAAKLIRAHSMATATELWGDIPFSEANMPETNPNPRFESQAELYPKLQTLIDEAIADLETRTGSISNSDLFLGGNVDAWIQAAHTLKARLYIDVKDYESAYNAAIQGIASAQNSMYAKHGNITNGNQNGMYGLLTSTRTGSIVADDAYNAYLLDPGNALYRGNPKTNETARYQFYYRANGENAPGIREPNTTTTNQFRGFFAQDAPFPLITYQENILTLAEMAVLTNKGDNTALAYLNEYRAYLNQGGYLHSTYLTNASEYSYLPYVLADFQPGGMENQDNITPIDALLREILEERYVSFYGQHIGWNDERRNRSKTTGIHLQPNNGNQLPWRFIYSQNELNSNENSPKPTPGLFDPIAIYSNN